MEAIALRVNRTGNRDRIEPEKKTGNATRQSRSRQLDE
jgi:hypothetical protein